jgi:DNA-binding beta-propeller fold protein YncE
MSAYAAGLRAALTALSLILAAGCSQDVASGGAAGFDPGPDIGVGGTSGAPGIPGIGGAGGRPPERELESRYLAPVVTDKYLWTANPISGRIAVIDVTTLDVTLTTAGNSPRRVVGLPALDGRVGALVLNEQSDDATLFRLDGAGRPVKHAPLRTHPDANSWAVSPSGRFAIAWTDAALRERPDVLETFQDITLFLLEPGEESVLPISVGARPSAFAFSADEAYAYAVTEQGLSVIELGPVPSVTDLVALDDDPLAEARGRDVAFSPDASYAVVRSEGESKIAFLSLPDGARTSVDLGGIVTDVDLSPDGAYAYAVLGHDAEVVQIPVGGASLDPRSFERLDASDGPAIGAIALNTDATAAVLYSTVLDANRVALLDTRDFGAGARVRRYDLIAPVNAVFAAPDPSFAVVFQGALAGSSKAGGFSLLSLGSARAPKIVATDAAPVQIAFSPESAGALVTVRSDAVSTFGAYLLDLASQRVDFVALASAPEAAGVVASARRAFVAQAHPEGRITFISTDDQSVQTLTGFELAARIRND